MVDNFFEVGEQIVAIATQVELDINGETSAKIEAKHKLANMASGLAATGASYAFEREDMELEASLSYSFTDIRYSKDAETLEISKAIESVLLENRSELEPYMVSEQNLADLHALIEEFESSLKIRGGVKSRNVAETKRLALLFRTLLRINISDLIIFCSTSTEIIIGLSSFWITSRNISSWFYQIKCAELSI